MVAKINRLVNELDVNQDARSIYTECVSVREGEVLFHGGTLIAVQ